MNAKIVKILTTSAALLVSSATLAFGAGSSNCQVIYGGGEVCPPEVKFTIDKKVMSPNKGGQFVDNLSANDPRFVAGDNVTFQLVVKNTGSKEVTLNVEDILPSYLDYVSGGTYDAGSKKVTNTVTLKAGEEKSYTVVAKVTSNENLPSNQTVVCVTNVARAKDNSGAAAEDNAQLCIEKGGKVTVQPKVPAKNIPDTGPEMLALAFLPPLGAAGLYLRRKASL